MKKILCSLSALIICVSLTACGEKSEVIDPTEAAAEKLSEVYNDCAPEEKKYVSLGYDGKSLTVDTRGDSEALSIILTANVYLNLPSSLTEKMSSTRAIDGTQTQDCGDYTVTWNYHPDDGMKVIYEVTP